MPRVLRKFFSAAAIVLLVTFAYEPLVDAEFVGEDFPVLIDAGRIAWPEKRPVVDGMVPGLESRDFYEVHGTDERPLAAMSLALSSRFWSDRGTWEGDEAVGLRAENLLLLCVAALALSRVVRRLLLPWTGSEHARTAGRAAALVYLVHPLSLSSVASVAARGDVLAMAIGLVGAAAFMRGRQERQYALTAGASVCALLAGLCSAISMFLPVILAIGEFISARRYRPASVRWRTAGTTLLIFGGAITLEALFRLALSDSVESPAYARSLAAIASFQSATQALSLTVEKLGVLFMPVNTFSLGFAGFAIAGMITLIAIQPALVAARSAPRLWIWLIIAWLVSVVTTELPQALVRVHSADLTHAQALFPAAAVMSVGLAVAATALSGMRRSVLPLVIATGFSVLAHANALPWKRASEEVARMRVDLDSARVLHGRDHRVLVLDPPTLVGGLDAVRPALPWMLDPAFNREENVTAGADSVRGLEFDAFRVLTREPEFSRLREPGVIIVFPPELFRRGSSEASANNGTETLPTTSGSRMRLSVLIESESESSQTRLWRGEGRSPVLDLEALAIRSIRVRALPETSAVPTPAVSWRTRSPLCERGEWLGVWVVGEDGPEAIFDVEQSPCWLLGLQARRVWFERVLTRIVSAEVLESPPPAALDLVPQIDGQDWVFDFPFESLPKPIAAESRWVVEFLDLATYRYFELEAELGSIRGLRVRGAVALETRLFKERGGPVVWSLDLRLDDTCVARTRGRRIRRALEKGPIDDTGASEPNED